MRHGVCLYEAMGLNRNFLIFRYGAHIYWATRSADEGGETTCHTNPNSTIIRDQGHPVYTI